MPFSQHPGRGLPSGWLPSTLYAGLAALTLLAPALAGAQTVDSRATAQSTEKNITSEVQKTPPVALPSLSPLVERVSPAVVNISAQMGSEAAALPERSADQGDDSGTPFDDLLRRFFENRGTPQPGREVMARGSGFIIDPTGYIVTNNHVVGKAEKITVILQDDSRHPAQVVGRDEKTDLALIKIDSKEHLPFVSWGDSDLAKVGDWVGRSATHSDWAAR